LSLAYFTEHEVLQFHPFTYKQHNFILLYSWIKLCCLYIPHFLIHLSVVGHLGCFQSLAIVNSAAVNMGAQVAPSYPVVHFLGYVRSLTSPEGPAVYFQVWTFQLIQTRGTWGNKKGSSQDKAEGAILESPYT
jgi:hypothetical protein